jgi:hypothetical protein
LSATHTVIVLLILALFIIVGVVTSVGIDSRVIVVVTFVQAELVSKLCAQCPTSGRESERAFRWPTTQKGECTMRTQHTLSREADQQPATCIDCGLNKTVASVARHRHTPRNRACCSTSLVCEVGRQISRKLECVFLSGFVKSEI